VNPLEGEVDRGKAGEGGPDDEDGRVEKSGGLN